MNIIMKSTLIAVSLLLLKWPAFPQNPEKVYSVVKEIHPFEWYQAQAEAWKKVLDREPSNGQAWLYFYTANRMMWLTENERFGKLSGPAFKTPSGIADMAGKAIPGTFEALYIKVWTHQDYPDHDKDLLRAYELGKGRTEILNEMCLFYEIRRDAAGRKEVNLQWFQSGEIPEGILNYNYNVLMTLTDDAIVITGGDNDTFPLWILQDALGIKPKVKVLNISLILKEDYRKKVFAELDIPDITLQPVNDDHPSNNFVMMQKVLGQILEKAKQPVFIALTLDRRYYAEGNLQNDLYLDGLALRYERKAYDNLGVIRRHFENDYLLDYLKVSFRKDASTPVVEQMNTGYLPALVKLCNHYRASGETSRQEAVHRMILGSTVGFRNETEFKELEPNINCN